MVARDTRLREIGVPLEGTIIETPGHTVDSVSILFDDCLIADAASNFLQFAWTKYCVIFVTDMDAYYKSGQRSLRGSSADFSCTRGII
jgi:glyoxylase-like metal-dependent hydrolase (beta-lactamase superfamily II)